MFVLVRRIHSIDLLILHLFRLDGNLYLLVFGGFVEDFEEERGFFVSFLGGGFE